MAATRIVAGILREIWQETAGQAGGPPQPVVTHIRLNARELSRVRAQLVIDGVVGAVSVSATAAVNADGFLTFAILNSAVGTTFTWTLDAQFTHSKQQGQDPLHGAYISIVNGYGGTNAQTLAQTYAIGAAQGDQTMVIGNIDNPGTVGIVIDGSTAAVTSDGAAIEVRQNALHAVPLVISRRIGGQNPGPNLQFSRARGTYAVPQPVANNDELATIDFYGYPVNAFTLDARIVATCEVQAPTYATGLHFYVTPRSGALTRVARLDANGLGANTVLTLYNTPELVSDTNHTGLIGVASQTWLAAHIDTVHAHTNVILHGAVLGGGAAGTVLLPNTATMPAPQANQAYVGCKDHTVDGVNLYAALAVSAEALVVPYSDPATDYIPIVYNGRHYYLLARDMTPA